VGLCFLVVLAGVVDLWNLMCFGRLVILNIC